MARARSRTRSFLTFVLALLLLAAGGFAVASILAGGPRELLARDPARADYTWLRQGLSRAEELSDSALDGTRRSGRLAAARALERAIRYSRASARRTGTETIPAPIRERLEGYFPEHLLDKVRWAFPNRYLDLGTLVAWYKAEGGAVTLQDTIIYASRVGVESEYLWAHELTHAMQYEELGLRDFARVYTTHYGVLEKQARDNGNRIVRDLRARDRRGSQLAPAPRQQEQQGRPEHRVDDVDVRLQRPVASAGQPIEDLVENGEEGHQSQRDRRSHLPTQDERGHDEDQQAGMDVQQVFGRAGVGNQPSFGAAIGRDYRIEEFHHE